jgi:hypothetical protein
MGGDMNSDPGSYAFTYILSQQIPFESLDEGIDHYYQYESE